MSANRPPLILHFVTWYPSPTNHAEGIFIQRQIELLAEDREYHHIIVQKNNTAVSAWAHIRALLGFYQTVQIGTLKVITIPNESRLYNIYFWRFRQQIEKWILHCLYIKYKPFLAHLHVVYGFAKEALYLKKKENLPFIVSEHMGPFPFEWISNKRELIIEPMQQASRVIAVSTAQAKQIETFTGILPVIIPNVVNEQEFYFSPQAIEFINNKTLQLVFTGIYTKAKGGDYLLRVFPEFLKVYPKTQLHIVGYATTERLNEIQPLLKQTNIINHVIFHGSLSPEQLNTLYQQCDFYVCSSEWESFGLSVLEGLFTGLPALCTDCGGVSDFINEENGIIIPNDQMELTLLNGMLTLAAGLNTYNRHHIAERVRLHFSRTFVKNQYLSIYQGILNKRPEL
jgi:glycosyltransferase involved in cell wall biosynthesis